MKCPSCQKEIKDNVKFCTFCGAKLPAVKYCHKCGARLNPDKKFCEKCGAPNDSYSHPQVSYPVYSQSEATNMGYRDSSFTDSSFSVGETPETDSSAKNPSDGNSEEIDSGLTPNESNQSDSNIHQEEDEKPADTDSEDFPEYKDWENEHSSNRNIVLAIVLVLISGGVLLLGQRLSWWNIGALSWVGGGLDQSEAVHYSDADLVEEVVADHNTWSVTPVGSDEKISFSMSLVGDVDGKYGVEMFLEGYRTSDGIYPESGKYYYSKYKGAWINLRIEVEKANSFKMFAYTDGNLTGTWNVYYDSKDRILKGHLTNYKGVTYPVELKVTLEDSSSAIETVRQDSLARIEKFKESIPPFREIYLHFASLENEYKTKVDLEKLGFVKKITRQKFSADNGEEIETEDDTYRLEFDNEHYCEIIEKSGYECTNLHFKIVGFPDLLEKYKDEAVSFKYTSEFEKFSFNPSMEINDTEIFWVDGL